jgi:tetratricopeptide (TPR) repeat protein
MAVFELRSSLSVEERLAKRKLIVRDMISLLSLFAITAVLAVLTYFLFSSFVRHRQELAQRWLARGQAAIASGHPEQAIEALRSALAYDPGQRPTEIKLATALAAAGRIQEATSYFNSLLETEPGNGLINLELARLATKQGKESEAIEGYQRALDGTWQGDGYLRRLSVRLELTHYLLERHNEARARTQLLIAEGNAPDDATIKLEIAGLLEQTQDAADALEIYRAIAQKKPVPFEALAGAGRTAVALGRFLLAREYLERTVDHPAFQAQSESVRAASREMLANTTRLLALFPDPELNVIERAKRILHAAEMSRARLEDCSTNKEPPIKSLLDLADRWQQVPANIRPLKLARNPQLEQTTTELIFDTEKQTAEICGDPTGDDALLLKIAQAPWAVDQR